MKYRACARCEEARSIFERASSAAALPIPLFCPYCRRPYEGTVVSPTARNYGSCRVCGAETPTAYGTLCQAHRAEAWRERWDKRPRQWGTKQPFTFGEIARARAAGVSWRTISSAHGYHYGNRAKQFVLDYFRQWLSVNGDWAKSTDPLLLTTPEGGSEEQRALRLLRHVARDGAEAWGVAEPQLTTSTAA